MHASLTCPIYSNFGAQKKNNTKKADEANKQATVALFGVVMVMLNIPTRSLMHHDAFGVWMRKTNGENDRQIFIL